MKKLFLLAFLMFVPCKVMASLSKQDKKRWPGASYELVQQFKADPKIMAYYASNSDDFIAQIVQMDEHNSEQVLQAAQNALQAVEKRILKSNRELFIAVDFPDTYRETVQNDVVTLTAFKARIEAGLRVS